MKAWNIKQLQEAKLNDLAQCTTQLERSMCEVICNREIRNLAEEIKLTRKLTPIEQAILESI